MKVIFIATAPSEYIPCNRTLVSMQEVLHASNLLRKWLALLVGRSVNPVIKESLEGEKEIRRMRQEVTDDTNRTRE